MSLWGSWWHSAWRAPGAGEAEHARHTAQRFHDMSQHMLVAATGTLLLLVLGQFLPWGEGAGRWLRWVWSGVLVLDVLVEAARDISPRLSEIFGGVAGFPGAQRNCAVRKSERRSQPTASG